MKSESRKKTDIMALQLPDDHRMSSSIATFAEEVRKLPNVAAMNITQVTVDTNITLRFFEI